MERGAEWLGGEEGDEAAGAPAPTEQPEVPAPVDWNADDDNISLCYLVTFPV